MPDLNELDLAFRSLQGAEHAVDAVAGLTVNSSHTPLMETVDKEVADDHGHRVWSSP